MTTSATHLSASWRRTLAQVWVALLVASSCGCSDPSGSSSSEVAEPPAKIGKAVDEVAEQAMPFFVDPADHDFSGNPRLLDRIRRSAHGYFRFINVQFAEGVCQRFRSELPAMPAVNLHGDAHIEQYAITSYGRGMTDFDDSATGPGILDLIRFGVSLRLTCDAREWGDSEAIYRSFLRGYKDALADPQSMPEPPVLAARIREGFSRDRTEFLTWAEGLMQPVETEARAVVQQAVRRYAAGLAQDSPDMETAFFEQKSMGALHMGIGSALDEKYIIRIEGLTSAADDDQILEVKEIRNLSGISCIQNAASVDPFRILVGQSRIAYEPYPYLGYAAFHGKTFWIHGWADNYKELEVETLPSVEELSEVAYDIGVQLGRGHTKQIAAPLDHQLRRRQRELVEAHQEAIVEAIEVFADDIVTGWERFRRESDSEAARSPQ